MHQEWDCDATPKIAQCSGAAAHGNEVEGSTANEAGMLACHPSNLLMYAEIDLLSVHLLAMLIHICNSIWAPLHGSHVQLLQLDNSHLEQSAAESRQHLHDQTSAQSSNQDGLQLRRVWSQCPAEQINQQSVAKQLQSLKLWLAGPPT